MQERRYEEAREIYAGFGVNADEAVAKLRQVSLSMHCWQGDDVGGFESAGGLSGGIAATGNYPGKPRNPQELMADMDQALALIPGRHRLNLHAIYAVTGGDKISRDSLGPEHFTAWVDFARERGLGLDFNPTMFSHPMAADGLTLSHPDQSVRQFWINHCRQTRKIAGHFGQALNTHCLHNIWIPDGSKDIPADRYTPRQRLKESLDAIFAQEVDRQVVLDSVESKVFGIGFESYTVGSHEFYLNYAARNNLLCLLDNGHYHPTETVSDKIPAMLLFFDRLALHVTRPVRWDSDHVVLFEEEIREIAKEVVRCDALSRVLIGLDYFDASINRVAAWVIGMRNTQKALLSALLMPHDQMARWQAEGDFTRLMVIGEHLKSCPMGDVWRHFCRQCDTPLDEEWYPEVVRYEKDVLSRRDR